MPGRPQKGRLRGLFNIAVSGALRSRLFPHRVIHRDTRQNVLLALLCLLMNVLRLLLLLLPLGALWVVKQRCGACGIFLRRAAGDNSKSSLQQQLTHQKTDAPPGAGYRHAQQPAAAGAALLSAFITASRVSSNAAAAAGCSIGLHRSPSKKY